MIKEILDKGRSGAFIGLPNGFHRLNKYLFGTQRGHYYVIMGGSGCGKTSLADQMYLFHPLVHERSDVYILYYTLELPRSIKLLKLLSRKVYEDKNILIDLNEMLSKTSKLSDDKYNILLGYESFIASVEKRVWFKEHISSITFEQDIISFLSKHGTFTYEDEKPVAYHCEKNKYFIILIDHIGLVSSDNKKQHIDYISRVLVRYRNMCDITAVVLMQVNRDSTSSLRRQTGFVDLQLSDAKDSGCPIEDADVVIGLLDPHKERQDMYRGYMINGGLEHRARVLSIIKNRYGESDKYAVLAFFGEVGKFIELPDPSKIDYKNIKLSTNE